MKSSRRILITNVVLVLLFSTAVSAQSRSRLKAPKTLLELLDQEDRNCVMQDGLQKSVTVRPIRLARDGTQQILVRGSGICLCGAQNCLFWIYRKRAGNYELLLKGMGSTRVLAGRHSSKRYRDVVSKSHASAAETIIRTYRYDGSRYQLKRCVNRAYYDDRGDYTSLPTYRPCGEDTPSEASIHVSASMLDRELTTIDNRKLKLADYPNRILVVSLFATWCRPCLETLLDLNTISKTLDEVRVIGVSSREGDPQIESVRTFAQTINLTFPLVWENIGFSHSFSKMVNARDSLPQTFVIDKEGRVRKHFVGFSPRDTPALLREALDQIRATDAR